MVKKTVLGLQLPTDPRWTGLASISLEEILTDHAYCEQKAAMSGISLIQGYPEREQLVRELAPVVAEEWEHFRAVLAELDRRGLKLGVQRRDEYVNALRKFNKSGISRDEALVEKLLTFALIEARSCERFRLLSVHLEDEGLRDFYHQFMVSEAGHYKMFLRLAKLYAPEEKVKQRWQEFLEYEAQVMAELTPRGDRIH